jgi:predicted PurR-regulated permease PerM
MCNVLVSLLDKTGEHKKIIILIIILLLILVLIVIAVVVIVVVIAVIVRSISKVILKSKYKILRHCFENVNFEFCCKVETPFWWK